MKKGISILITVAFAIGLLFGCSKKEDAQTDDIRDQLVGYYHCSYHRFVWSDGNFDEYEGFDGIEITKSDTPNVLVISRLFSGTWYLNEFQIYVKKITENELGGKIVELEIPSQTVTRGEGGQGLVQGDESYSPSIIVSIDNNKIISFGIFYYHSDSDYKEEYLIDGDTKGVL